MCRQEISKSYKMTPSTLTSGTPRGKRNTPSESVMKSSTYPILSCSRCVRGVYRSVPRANPFGLLSQIANILEESVGREAVQKRLTVRGKHSLMNLPARIDTWQEVK